ncbi:MAG: hypothetical protein ABJH04_12220 [Cyclobacteriaceae bacterium]
MQTYKAEEYQKLIVVEVFKTNVDNDDIALQIITALQRIFPTYRINFDLDDCDKILRVESATGQVNTEELISLVKEEKVNIEILE